MTDKHSSPGNANAAFDLIMVEADWADMHGGEHHDDTCDVCKWIEIVRRAINGHAQGKKEPTYEQLHSVFEAAFGLCCGYDWNKGTAAKACGYRKKLLSAVNAIKEVPDFEHKYRLEFGSPLSSTERGSDV